jgi:signal transduction histidine kinase
MLGRQQIAGIPTAISELFKNAHDAYATRVEVDFYRWNRMLILRDDGIGMTREDFEQRWLTLGTESKLGRGPLKPPPTRGAPRPVMGEKGIGRLAIGIVGPQVLILTRAQREGENHPIVAALVNWSAFAIPGANLDEIEVPVREFQQLPNASEVREMVDALLEGLDRLTDVDESEVARVKQELAGFNVDPHLLSPRLGEPSLNDSGVGTQFYIMPTDDSLVADLEPSPEGGAGALVKFLIGFTNTMTRGHSAPVIVPRFRDHHTKDSYLERIGPSEFWAPDDISAADHTIRGTFDEFGQFQGSIRIFRNPEVGHVVPWTSARGRQTDCGAFSIDLGVMQGKATESTLPPHRFAEIKRKLDLMAGVYVYRDGLRVLPYGNNDYDWLDIEKRRTKSASYYYFSYRNVFGAILITREQNAALVEKAGREGFQENRAYRQFRSILSNFFVQIASDFFREGTATADPFLEAKAEFDRIKEARKKHARKVSEQRVALGAELEEFFEAGPIERATARAELIAALVESEARAAVAVEEPGIAAESLLRLEGSVRRRIANLKEEFTVRKPRGMVLKGRLRDSYERYESEASAIEKTIIAPLRTRLDQVVSDAVGSRRLDVDRRIRIERALEETESEIRRDTSVLAKETSAIAVEVGQKVETLARQAVADIERVAREVDQEFARIDFSALPDDEAVEVRTKLEDRLRAAAEDAQGFLNAARDQLVALGLERDEEGQLVGAEDVRAAIEEQLAILEERADADVELTQMGMAIEVINHEFEGSVRAMRENLRRLRSWADVNPKLGNVYRDLLAGFQHLDGYLKLFTPLHRRLYRTPIEISGADIAKYLRDVFRKRMDDEESEIKVTRRFMDYRLTGYPSTFYPVFVNLVDNALFWIKDRPQPRQILLDVDAENMLVSDTGPGIPIRDTDRIFERGFTRKPMGRGVGLFVSREVLRESGYRLSVEPQGRLGGATFVISKTESEDQ